MGVLKFKLGIPEDILWELTSGLGEKHVLKRVVPQKGPNRGIKLKIHFPPFPFTPDGSN